MKKLISAVCLLLVATVMLGSTTFAWFSMNTEVTATGLSVTAEAPNSLLISTSTTAGTAGQAVALSSITDVATLVAPVTHNTKYLFVKLTGDGCATVDDEGKVNGDAATEVAAFKTSTYTELPADPAPTYITSTVVDYFKDTIYLTYTGNESGTEGTPAGGTAGVKLTAAYTNGSSTDDIKNAMHVLLVDANGKGYDLDMEAAAAGVQLANIETNAANPTEYTVYYYLDGEDDDCYNESIKANATLSVTLTFTVTNPVAEE